MFRDNKQRMIENQQVLILAASVTTGKTISKAIESILYYGGTVCGVSAIFSAVYEGGRHGDQDHIHQQRTFRITGLIDPACHPMCKGRLEE